ncbi:hypothetical protein J3E64_002522 [Sphingobium sp. OAS761]|uniref:alpha/beta hydrolase n=1 Tax=Sphingobium sp. OAS761 TaxID=2817901 RepID=UPI00209D704B|nr:alpha/beta fold hydrolase [Sphingobium sp. OAS761]MCP1470829.1 hypothetical protein [Sphingobium sp. OAS761]
MTGTAGRWWKAAGLAAALALTGCASVLRDHIYQADPRPVHIGDYTGRKPETLTVRTTDGMALTGYYWRGAPDDHDVILFFHGRGSNQGIAARYAEQLTGRGDHVVVVSYRGFGGNPGTPTQAGLIADGLAFTARARDLAGPNAHLFLVGHSLGGAVALHVGARVPVSGVATLSAFDRLAESAPAGTGSLLPDRWNNLEALPRIEAPVIMMQGTADRRVDAAQADRLFAAARSPTVRISMTGAGHHPDMARIGPVITQWVAAIDAGRFATYSPAIPAGWAMERK